ncbi:MAG: hypothetical protein ABSC06_11760 [Rhodopila sp.]
MSRRFIGRNYVWVWRRLCNMCMWRKNVKKLALLASGVLLLSSAAFAAPVALTDDQLGSQTGGYVITSNGNGNGNGNGNIGSLNGNGNGNGNIGSYNGNLNGNLNFGSGNGNLNGNFNFGYANGNGNGNGNLGLIVYHAY